MSNPKVSIIVPIFKADKYLERCLDSILAQTFEDWECILVNDGSPDSSGDICDTYSHNDDRFRVIHKKNEGVSAARQTGLDLSIGDFCSFVDPDDWIESNMLYDLYNKAIAKNADLVICDFYQDESSKSKYRKQEPSALDSSAVLEDMIVKLKGCCWNKLYKTNVIKKNKIKFPVELSFCEDLYFNLSLLRFDIKISYLNEAFYHYIKYENQNSLSASANGNFEQDLLMFEKFKLLLDKSRALKKYTAVYSALVIRRNYNRNRDSALQFVKHCFPLVKYMKFTPKNYLILGLSSLGLYPLVRLIFKQI